MQLFSYRAVDNYFKQIINTGLSVQEMWHSKKSCAVTILFNTYWPSIMQAIYSNTTVNIVTCSNKTVKIFEMYTLVYGINIITSCLIITLTTAHMQKGYSIHFSV